MLLRLIHHYLVKKSQSYKQAAFVLLYTPFLFCYFMFLSDFSKEAIILYERSISIHFELVKWPWWRPHGLVVGIKCVILFILDCQEGGLVCQVCQCAFWEIVETAESPYKH